MQVGEHRLQPPVPTVLSTQNVSLPDSLNGSAEPLSRIELSKENGVRSSSGTSLPTPPSIVGHVASVPFPTTPSQMAAILVALIHDNLGKIKNLMPV